MQTSIFEIMYPKYKITKPIRLIEFFAGYGSQALALKYLGVEFEHWKICEWAIKSIQAYKDIHFSNDNEDYSINLNKDELISYLLHKGISNNYNNPMNETQIRRLNENVLRTIYNNIIATNNLVNIQQIKGEDLEIKDNNYTYLLTYSFPCQDLSLAGKGKGMGDTTTRSGMLWEVERILKECDKKPDILLMENVPQVHGANNVQDFNKWQLRLEELGYKNYFSDLIATDFGIPQTRNRCFMVSILGDYSYTFPKPIPLKLKLKDMLEDNVDEKYYLSDKMKQYIFSEDDKYKVNKNSLKLNRDIACSKTTREGNTRADTSDYILETNNKRLNETAKKLEDKECQMLDCYNNNVLDNMSKTIDTGVSFRNSTFIAIKNATKKGYLEAKPGGGIDISSRMEHHRGTVQKEMIPTLKTAPDIGVVVEKNLKQQLCEELIEQNKVQEMDVIRHSYSTSRMNNFYKQNSKNNNTSPTLDTRCDCLGVTVNNHNNLRIRKLTPRECFRLMGVKDEDFDKVSKNQSDSSLYHLAGDSIVVNVLMAIFKEMF